MRTVTITKQPGDEEFWAFEALLGELGTVERGWTKGPHFVSVGGGLVIGGVERCLEVRTELGQATGIPTRACQGPFYFRRD